MSQQKVSEKHNNIIYTQYVPILHNANINFKALRVLYIIGYNYYIKCIVVAR